MDRIDGIIEARSLLKHPFYQAWTKGTLPLSSLAEYAAQYYHFEKEYPRFLSGVHHRCDDARVRQVLLDNLWDEEHGEENHVELWLRFCDALGLDRDEVTSREPAEASDELVRTFTRLTTEQPTAAGAAALYAFESTAWTAGSCCSAREDQGPQRVLRHGRRAGGLLQRPRDSGPRARRGGTRVDRRSDYQRIVKVGGGRGY